MPVLDEKCGILGEVHQLVHRAGSVTQVMAEADLKRKKKQRQLHVNVLDGLVTKAKNKMDIQDTACEDDVTAVKRFEIKRK